MILPDMKTGIFICLNGPDYIRSDNALKRIRLFTMDILLEEEPWINSTYPLPYDLKFNSDSDYLIEKAFHDEYNHMAGYEERIIVESKHALVDYQGTYGNFAMGNVTLVYDENNDTLTAYYGLVGRFNVVIFDDEDASEHLLLAKPLEPFWFYPPVRVMFHIDDEGVPYAFTVPAMLPEYPPTFYRDLDMADAPPPPDNCL